MTFAWNALTKNFATVSLPIALAVLVAWLPGFLVSFVYSLIASVVARYVEAAFLQILGGLVQATTGLLGFFISSYLAGGVVAFSLKVARGQNVAMGDVFGGGRYFGRMLVANLLVGLTVMLGVLLCVVPGYIAAYGLALTCFLVVDQGAAGVDALKRSWAMTDGHKLNIFVLHLLGLVAVVAGMFACGVGVIVGSIPLICIAGAYAYLRIKGEQPQLQP